MILGYVLACEKSAAGSINPIWFPVTYRITRNNRKRFEKALRKKYKKANEWTIDPDDRKEYKYRVGIYYKENFNLIHGHPAHDEVMGKGVIDKDNEGKVNKLYSLKEKAL